MSSRHHLLFVIYDTYFFEHTDGLNRNVSLAILSFFLPDIQCSHCRGAQDT